MILPSYTQDLNPGPHPVGPNN